MYCFLYLFSNSHQLVFLLATGQKASNGAEGGDLVYFLVIGLLLFASLLNHLYGKLKLWHTEQENIRKERLYYEEASPVLDAFLNKFPYYIPLSPEGKARFKSRLIDFLLSKQFTGAEGLQVTEDMKVQISAAAVQLTFGLKNYFITFFHTIQIYPGTFYSKLVGARLKGGTSNLGLIQLSWPDFLSGYAIPDDKLNLGLHELSHALEISVLRGSDFDKQFAAYLELWEEKSDDEYTRLHAHEKSFLRAYGGTNPHEFFAVCVEHFFEAPLEFSQRLPQLYKHLTTLLNQDPSRKNSDYEPEYNLIGSDANGKLKISYRYSTWHWSLTVLLVGIFTGPIALFYENSLITYNPYGFGTLYLGVVLAGAIPNYRYLVKRKVLNIPQYMGYMFLGFGFLTTAFLLFLNSFGGCSRPRTEVIQMDGTYSIDYNRAIVGLSYNTYGAIEDARKISLDEVGNIRQGNFLVLVFENGILGIETCQANRVVLSYPSKSVPPTPEQLRR